MVTDIALPGGEILMLRADKQQKPSMSSRSRPPVSEEEQQTVRRGCTYFSYRPRFLDFVSPTFMKFQLWWQEKYNGRSRSLPLGDLKQGTHILDAMQGKQNVLDKVKQQRLMLVLDLDNTLLQSSSFYSKQLDKRIRKMNCMCNEKNVFTPATDLFVVKKLGLVTKLRPHIREFLDALDSMYDMYVYTMRNHTYALEMVKLLDPTGRFFRNKVMSSESSTVMGTKALDVLPGSLETIVVVDDMPEVWRRSEDRERVLHIKHYGFKGSGCDWMEEEDDTALLSVLTVLKRIHSEFLSFSDQQLLQQETGKGPNTESNTFDSSVTIKKIRSSVLGGCCIVFGSDVFSMDAIVEDQGAWKMASSLGAVCTTKLVSVDVTHIVAKRHDTHEARWAVANKKFLVSLSWLEEAYYFWVRPLEENFPVRHARGATSVP